MIAASRSVTDAPHGTTLPDQPSRPGTSLGAKLGLIVNPIAGMGGAVALKGSDDAELVAAARGRGALPVAPQRAVEALRPLAAARESLDVLTYPREMGEAEAREAGLEPRVVGSLGAVTSAADTRSAATAMAGCGVDLVLFAGGDGTAVDILGAIADRVPVLGVPAGVKMHSAVFAVNPKSAGELAVRFVEGGVRELREAEVMDVDEAALRAGAISARLHGYLMVPAERRLVQSAKARTLARESAAQEGIAHYVVDRVFGERTWLIGPGTTTRAVMDVLGLEKTLLGVDVVREGSCLIADADERALLEFVGKTGAGILVTPVGGQGFVFGRGNQQLSARVIERVGRERIVVIATEAKIAALGGHPLRVDTGVPAVDASLSGYLRVIVGYNREIVYRIAS
jgi:predicted polyphosphate/ATP-dependent NAD kinase